MLSLQSITYPEPATPMMLPIYLGDRQRYPSVTDVLLLRRPGTKPLLFAVAHRYAAKIYLTEVDVDQRERHLFVIKTQHDGMVHYVESMEFDEERKKIYVICYSEYLLTYRFVEEGEGPRLLFERAVRLGSHIRYHGMKLHQDCLYLTPSMSDIDGQPTEILKCDLETGREERLTSPDILPNYRVKDIIFVGTDRVILVINYKIQKKMTQRGAVFHGFLGLYRWPELQQLDKVEYSHVHFDRGVLDRSGPGPSIFYITGGDRKGGYLWRGHVEGAEIQMMEKIQVADFPHGIRVESMEGGAKKMLLYTSYGTDSMYYGCMKE